MFGSAACSQALVLLYRILILGSKKIKPLPSSVLIMQLSGPEARIGLPELALMLIYSVRVRSVQTHRKVDIE